MNLSEFKGKTALVTGASSGLGADFARHLARAGADLILSARRVDALEALAGELKAQFSDLRVQVIPQDLASPEGVDELAAKIQVRGLQVDILINNAGYGSFGRFDEIPWEKERTMMSLDMMAVVRATRLFSRGMKDRGWGRILQVASIAAFQAAPLYASYAGAKAFVLSYSLAVNHELKGTGVQVTVLSPGVTATEFFNTAEQTMTPYQKMVMMSSTDVTRIGLKALAAGRKTIVPGFVNKASAVMTRFIGRGLAAAVAEKLMK